MIMLWKLFLGLLVVHTLSTCVVQAQNSTANGTDPNAAAAASAGSNSSSASNATAPAMAPASAPGISSGNSSSPVSIGPDGSSSISAGTTSLLPNTSIDTTGTILSADIDLTSSTYMSIAYRNTFHISVYRQVSTSGATKDNQYLYCPSLLLLPNATTIFFDNSIQKYTVRFPIQMWETGFSDFLYDYINKSLLEYVPRTSVRVLPIADIRVDTVERYSDCKMSNLWMSYVSYPAVIKPRMLCNTGTAAQAVVDLIKSDSPSFAASLQVMFSLQKHLRGRRPITVKQDHVNAAEKFSILNVTYANFSMIYTRSVDALELVKDIAAAVMSAELGDDEFVRSFDYNPFIRALQRLLAVRPISTASFTPGMWAAVQWGDNTTRPDTIATGINALLLGTNTRIRSALIHHAIMPNDQLTELFNTDTVEYSGINNQIQAMSDYIRFNGTFYEAKPVILTSINMTLLRSPVPIGSVPVWVTRSTAYLHGQVNYIDDVEFQQALKKTTSPSDLINPIGSIVAYFSSSYLPDGWMWCNGSMVDPVRYPRLARLLHPSTTTPDLSGQFLIGANRTSTGPWDFTRIGTMGGEVNHVLTVAEMPKHNHSWPVSYGTSRTDQNTGLSVLQYKEGVNHTAVAGGDQGHNNLPPFTVVTYIIKAG